MAGLDRRRFLGAVGAAGLGAVLTAKGAGAGLRQQVVYLGSYSTWGEPPGAGLQVATRSGQALRVGATVADMADSSWLALSADRRRMYVTNELEAGRVTALDVSDAARPRILNSRSTGGAHPTHLTVHPSGKYLLSANYTGGSVAVNPILAGGKLGEPTDVVKHPKRERDPHAHQVVVDPSGRWVLAVDLGADAVFVYRLDQATGKLALNQRLDLPSGAGPRHLAFHPRGGFAYVLGELRAEITVAAFDAGRGRLTTGQVIPTVDPSAPAPQYPAEIVVSPDGRFVYASNRGEDTIATFTVNGASLARLTPNVPTGGVWPRHFTLDPSGRWIYVANQRSGTVSWLPRDPATGRLGKAAGTTPVGHVAFVLFR
ncbi:lactonase family protein [Amycolatopsis suaedae]|uniref:Lactonase family protein n=1 Tax=Amycolatopsis suaedae TaxID=2510978 RepID=A0A4Q7J971_9PSEU|nr:lactonase family protein [Amycolatopsis suaedae]RZQ62943.1 lactonase family protein [Amycolatopsis suaedae]